MLIEFGALSRIISKVLGRVKWERKFGIVQLFYMVLMIGEECHKFHEFLSLLKWDKVVSFKLNYGDWLMACYSR